LDYPPPPTPVRSSRDHHPIVPADDRGFTAFHGAIAQRSSARLAATLFSGSVPGTIQKNLGTFTFRASAYASGTFIVTLRPVPETLLRDARSASVTWEPGLSATVVVE
jgi:hypothetical protein